MDAYHIYRFDTVDGIMLQPICRRHDRLTSNNGNIWRQAGTAVPCQSRTWHNSQEQSRRFRSSPKSLSCVTLSIAPNLCRAY